MTERVAGESLRQSHKPQLLRITLWNPERNDGLYDSDQAEYSKQMYSLTTEAFQGLRNDRPSNPGGSTINTRAGLKIREECTVIATDPSLALSCPS